MSDCPNSAHGHELVFKNNWRILSAKAIAQSCYCKHCGDELRRVYVTGNTPAPTPDITYGLTDELVVTDPEMVLRRVETHWPLLNWMAYKASHVEGRPIEEPGDGRATIK